MISDFITAEIARLEDKQFSDGSTQRSIETLNELFRDALREVWR